MTLLTKTDIGEADFTRVAGTPEECLIRAAEYKTAEIDELALTFSGASAKDEIAAIGEALRRYGGAIALAC